MSQLLLHRWRRCCYPLSVLGFLLLSGCTSPAPAATATPTVLSPPVLLGSCTLNVPSTATAEDALRAVINAEGEFVVQQDITRLMQLWHAGARVVDAHHTAQDTTDDQQWLDKDAIRHRYVRTVFPGAPTTIVPKDFAITLVGAQATVTTTTQIGNEISPAGDRWTLSKAGDCWAIDSLTYNLEAATD